MPGTNLIVPVVLWGKHAPTHCISSVYLSRDQKTLVTGCYDGQICIWQVNPDTLKMTPRCLLVGHTAPVTCLSRASIIQDNNFIVSSSEAGEMCTWDLVDGKCRESVKLSQIHTNIQAYHMCNSEDLRLFCNGYYAEILIMDPFSLEILFSLSSKMNPDWISALHVLRPSSRKDDVVLAISITGTVKVWSLLGHENKQSEPIYENESKQIRCLNALSLNCCAYNQRTVLVVCAKYCQIYDAGDFSVLCSIQAPSGERWMSGDFLAPDRVLVWSTEGKGYLYKLPANSVPDHKGFHGPTVDHDSPVLFSILAHPDNKLLSCPPAMRFILTSVGGKQRRLLLRGDSAGVVSLWNVDDAATPVPSSVPSHAPIVMTSLDMAWAEMNPGPVGILDQFGHPDEPEIKLTASIYILAANRLVVGRSDGSIVIVNATHTVQLQLLHGAHQQLDDWPPHQLLLGHNGRVNCLLYPHHVHQRYDKSHLVSGGIDFAVCLWDLFSGSLLHRFCVHAGEITQLIVPPHNCSSRIQKCICSVASDHSVTLLSLSERKCVTLASRHLFPVVTIKWRPADDFMVVGCSDGTVLVWQMETGHLDRVLHGMIAEEVLAACDETLTDDLGGSISAGSGDLQGLANPAVHFFRGLRHRNLTAMRAATARGLAALQAPERGGGAGPLAEPARPRRAPLTVQGFRSNPADPESHILFFDIEGLIVELLSEEYSAMSPASLEAAGLITSEYMKVAALTQSASPDATKRISDILGRVKDKAGDVERKLKEKDKHGILAKMKEGAENMQTKLQAKAEQLKSHIEQKATCHYLIPSQVQADKKYNNENESKNSINKVRLMRAVDFDYMNPNKIHLLSHNTGKEKAYAKSRNDLQQKNKTKARDLHSYGEKNLNKDLKHFLKLLAKTNNKKDATFNSEALKVVTEIIVGPKLLRIPRKQVERLGRKLRDYTSEEYDYYDDSNKRAKTTTKPKLTKTRTKTRTRSKRPTRTKSRRTTTKRTQKPTTTRSPKTRPSRSRKPPPTRTRTKPIQTQTHKTTTTTTTVHRPQTTDPFENWFTEPISYWPTISIEKLKNAPDNQWTTPLTKIVDVTTSDDGYRSTTETSEYNPWKIPDWAKEYFAISSHRQGHVSTPRPTMIDDTKISVDGYGSTTSKLKNKQWNIPDLAKEYVLLPSPWHRHTKTPRSTTVDDFMIFNNGQRSTTRYPKYKKGRIPNWAKKYFSLSSHWQGHRSTPRTRTVNHMMISNQGHRSTTMDPNNNSWKIPYWAKGYFTLLSHRHDHMKYIQDSFEDLSGTRDEDFRAVNRDIRFKSEQIVKRLLTALFIDFLK